MNTLMNAESPFTSQFTQNSMNAASNSAKFPVDVVLDDDEGDENAKIFPQRLMEILTNPSNQDAISWLPHGKAFIIVNRQKFAENVLPHYFRKSKYTSFTRKLNRWNFIRVTRGPELGAYYHEFFQRGSEAMCTQMYCKNERAKFAVTGREGKRVTDVVASDVVSLPVEAQKDPRSSTVQVNDPVHHLSAAELMHVNNMMTKSLMPTMDPSAQSRMLLHGGIQMRTQDPMIKSIMESAIMALHQSNCNSSAQQLLMQQSSQGSACAAFLRMQHFAVMQQQQQQQASSQQRPLTFHRASAA